MVRDVDHQDQLGLFVGHPGASDDADGGFRGDECECTDQTGDGFNTVSDIVAINVAIFNPELVTPLCDVTGKTTACAA